MGAIACIFSSVLIVLGIVVGPRVLSVGSLAILVIDPLLFASVPILAIFVHDLVSFV